SGFPVTRRSGSDVIEVAFPTSSSEEARERFALRERVAAAAGVRTILEPRSVALIGASRRKGSIGNTLALNLLEGDPHHATYLVGRPGPKIAGQEVLGSIAEIDEPIDLAVIAVSAVQVTDVARQCADAGVRALVVISAGFTEIGPEGARRQEELLDI